MKSFEVDLEAMGRLAGVVDDIDLRRSPTTAAGAVPGMRIDSVTQANGECLTRFVSIPVCRRK